MRRGRHPTLRYRCPHSAAAHDIVATAAGAGGHQAPLSQPHSTSPPTRTSRKAPVARSPQRCERPPAHQWGARGPHRAVTPWGRRAKAPLPCPPPLPPRGGADGGGDSAWARKVLSSSRPCLSAGTPIPCCRPHLSVGISLPCCWLSPGCGLSPLARGTASAPPARGGERLESPSRLSTPPGETHLPPLPLGDGAAEGGPTGPPAGGITGKGGPLGLAPFRPRVRQ